MPSPELFLRYDITTTFLPLTETDREGLAQTFERLAETLLMRACELRKGEPCGSSVEAAWPTTR